ncbi:MAG: hypothetical protein ACKV2V_07425 [Blastocatellia bacterium]
MPALVVSGGKTAAMTRGHCPGKMTTDGKIKGQENMKTISHIFLSLYFPVSFRNPHSD